MIANDEQLQLVRDQVGRLESAIHSLAKTVRPRSEQQFQLLSEGFVHHLRILRLEIDEYLGIAQASEADAARVALKT